GRDRLKAGDARAYHEDLGGKHHACSRCQHWEIAIDLDRREEDAFVAADVGHRGERIHRLRARRPWNRVGRKGGDAPGGERLHGIEISEWHQGADVNRPRPYSRQLIAPNRRDRWTNFEHEIRGAKERDRLSLDSHAKLTIDRIGKTRLLAGTRF